MVEPPRQFAQEEVEALLERHLVWLESEGEDGERANLQGVYLWQVNLPDAVLRQADLGVFWSSRPGEFHPWPLTEPDVTVSCHPALLIQSYGPAILI